MTPPSLPVDNTAFAALTLIVAVDATIETFNLSAYRAGLAALLYVPADVIQITLAAGSLVVRATVLVYSAAASDALFLRISAITPAQLEAATGCTVATISTITVVRLLPSPPPVPMPSPPLAPPGDDDNNGSGGWLLVGLIAAAAGLLVLLGALVAVCVCLGPEACVCTTKSTRGAAPAPAPNPAPNPTPNPATNPATNPALNPAPSIQHSIDDGPFDVDHTPPAPHGYQDLDSRGLSLPSVNDADATEVLAQFWYDGYVAANADAASFEPGVAQEGFAPTPARRAKIDPRRLAGSPGSPVMRTPALTSHPGRETSRVGRSRAAPPQSEDRYHDGGAGVVPPPPLTPPPEWVATPEQDEPGAPLPMTPGMVARRNEELTEQLEREHKRQTDLIKRTASAAPAAAITAMARTFAAPSCAPYAMCHHPYNGAAAHPMRSAHLPREVVSPVCAPQASPLFAATSPRPCLTPRSAPRPAACGRAGSSAIDRAPATSRQARSAPRSIVRRQTSQSAAEPFALPPTPGPFSCLGDRMERVAPGSIAAMNHELMFGSSAQIAQGTQAAALGRCVRAPEQTLSVPKRTNVSNAEGAQQRPVVFGRVTDTIHL